TSPDDHHTLRELRHIFDAIAGHHYFFIDGQLREITWTATGSENNVISPHYLNTTLRCNSILIRTQQERDSFLVCKKAAIPLSLNLPNVIYKHNLPFQNRISYFLLKLPIVDIG